MDECDKADYFLDYIEFFNGRPYWTINRLNVKAGDVAGSLSLTGYRLLRLEKRR